MREFLKGLELDSETTDTIMAEYGKNIQGLKEERDSLKEQLKGFENSDSTIKSLTSERDDYKSKYEEELGKRTSIENCIKVKEAKIDDKFKDFVISEVSKLVDEKTDFDAALKGFVEKNPQYKVPEKTRKVNSSFSMVGNSQSESSKNDVFNNALLMAVGRK